MSCEDNMEIKTGIVVAANKLAEARKASPGSMDHATAMAELLNGLHQPGALDTYEALIQNGNGNISKVSSKPEVPPTADRKERKPYFVR